MPRTDQPRTKYKFKGRYEGVYFWESVGKISPRDSRVEVISCTVDWFWGRVD